jgi:hypothetical protein
VNTVSVLPVRPHRHGEPGADGVAGSLVDVVESVSEGDLDGPQVVVLRHLDCRFLQLLAGDPDRRALPPTVGSGELQDRGFDARGRTRRLQRPLGDLVQVERGCELAHEAVAVPSGGVGELFDGATHGFGHPGVDLRVGAPNSSRCPSSRYQRDPERSDDGDERHRSFR